MVAAGSAAGVVREETLRCSQSWVEEAIADGREWREFDDAAVLQHIRALAASADASSEVQQMAEAILLRSPPKLIAEVEYIRGRDASTKKHFLLMKKMVGEHMEGWATHFNIPRRHWHVWVKSGIVLTKVGSHLPVSAAKEPSGSTEPDDRFEQAIRILDANGRTSRPIMELPSSMMNILGDQALYALRVYVLLPKGDEGRRQEISAHIRSDLNEVEWK